MYSFQDPSSGLSRRPNPLSSCNFVRREHLSSHRITPRHLIHNRTRNKRVAGTSLESQPRPGFPTIFVISPFPNPPNGFVVQLPANLDFLAPKKHAARVKNERSRVQPSKPTQDAPQENGFRQKKKRWSYIVRLSPENLCFYATRALGKSLQRYKEIAFGHDESRYSLAIRCGYKKGTGEG